MPARSYSMENDANASFIRQMQRLGPPTPRPAKTTSPAAKSDSHTSNDGIYPLVRPCQGEKAKLRGESKQDYDRTMTSFERQMQKLREQQAKEKDATMLDDDEQEL